MPPSRSSAIDSRAFCPFTRRRHGSSTAVERGRCSRSNRRAWDQRGAAGARRRARQSFARSRTRERGERRERGIARGPCRVSVNNAEVPRCSAFDNAQLSGICTVAFKQLAACSGLTRGRARIREMPTGAPTVAPIEIPEPSPVANGQTTHSLVPAFGPAEVESRLLSIVRRPNGLSGRNVASRTRSGSGSRDRFDQARRNHRHVAGCGAGRSERLGIGVDRPAFAGEDARRDY